MTAHGPDALVISSISVTGNFLESDNCKGSLSPGRNCSISVTFFPGAAGPATGAIIASDNGPGGSQTVPLSGTGIDFALSAAPSSVTVNAGNSASYTVAATAIGGSFDFSESLGCSGLPAAAKCQFSPGSVTPHAGSASSALTIQTTRRKGSTGTPAGQFAMTVTGTSNGLTRAAAVTLMVN